MSGQPSGPLSFEYQKRHSTHKVQEMSYEIIFFLTKILCIYFLLPRTTYPHHYQFLNLKKKKTTTFLYV